MTVLRTPDERFANLPGYQFAPNHVEVETKGEADSIYPPRRRLSQTKPT
jgi:hypothetical protein